MSKLAENLRYYREKNNLKQEDIANYVNKSKGVVSNWEKGLNRPDADTIAALCELLNITPNDLFGWNEEEKEKTPSAKQAEEAMRSLLHYRYDRAPTENEMDLFSTVLPVLTDGVKDKAD